jgi:hypothetical protein
MNIETAVYLAAIAAAASIISPLLMSWITERNRAKAKAEDYARQDAVAAKAEEAAGRVDEVAKVLAESNRRSEETSKVQGAKLDQIHTLVNSNMTAEMEKGLASHKALLALLIRLAPEEKIQIETTTRVVAELEAQLADRMKQTQVADEKRSKA